MSSTPHGIRRDTGDLQTFFLRHIVHEICRISLHDHAERVVLLANTKHVANMGACIVGGHQCLDLPPEAPLAIIAGSIVALLHSHLESAGVIALPPLVSMLHWSTFHSRKRYFMKCNDDQVSAKLPAHNHYGKRVALYGTIGAAVSMVCACQLSILA